MYTCINARGYSHNRRGSWQHCVNGLISNNVVVLNDGVVHKKLSPSPNPNFPTRSLLNAVCPPRRNHVSRLGRLGEVCDLDLWPLTYDTFMTQFLCQLPVSLWRNPDINILPSHPRWPLTYNTIPRPPPRWVCARLSASCCVCPTSGRRANLSMSLNFTILIILWEIKCFFRHALDFLLAAPQPFDVIRRWLTMLTLL